MPAAAVDDGNDFPIGCFLWVQTTFGDEFQGHVITFDLQSNLLAIQEGSNPHPGNRRNIRLLKANYIKDYKHLGQSEDPLDVSKCSLDLSSLRAREELAIRKAEADAQRTSPGVNADAQSIFDTLSKTLPVQWDETDILVMRQVRVTSPYLPECVSGGTPAANERVRKVLEFERKRLQLRGAGQ